MALSLSNFLICCGYFLTIIKLAESAIVNYDFNITWVRANPDGLFERPTIGINGAWPIPRIEATIGDRIIVNVHNQLGNQSTSLHFHGLFQNGTTSMDGPVGVSQCAIPPGASFKYNFTVSVAAKMSSNYLIPSRLINQEHTGTIPTTSASIQTGSAAPLSSTIRSPPTKRSTTKSSSSPSQTGTTMRCPPSSSTLSATPTPQAQNQSPTRLL